MTRYNRSNRPDLERRIVVDGQTVTGPVQSMLLEAIHSTGSIAAARRQIGADYACGGGAMLSRDAPVVITGQAEEQ